VFLFLPSPEDRRQHGFGQMLEMMRFTKEGGVVGGDGINQYVAFDVAIRPIEYAAIFAEVRQTQGTQAAAEAAMDERTLFVTDDNAGGCHDEVGDLMEIAVPKCELLLHDSLPVSVGGIRRSIEPANRRRCEPPICMGER
jgi:hypothetical protein